MSRWAISLSTAFQDQRTFTLIVSAGLALVVSYLILRLYRRAVFVSMRRRTRSDLLDTKGYLPPEPAHRPHDAPLSFNFVGRGATETSRSAVSLYRTVLWRRGRTAMIHAVAGACFAAAMTAALLSATKMAFAPLHFLYLTWVNAWPAVFAADLAVGFSRRGRFAGAAVYFLIGITLGVLAIIHSPRPVIGDLVNLWLHYNAPATLLLGIFLHRRIRAVGPLMLILMLLTVTGTNFIVTSTRSHPKLLKALGEFTLLIGLGPQGTLVALQLIGFAILAIASWLVLGALSKLYQTKSISEQSINIDAVWLLFGIVNSIDLTGRGPWWFYSGVVAFALYKFVALGLFRIFGNLRRAAACNRRLLMLRAFAFGTRKDKLYDLLGKSWRTIGSIQMIAGRDLTTSGIEPHEFWDFVGGNFPRRFVDSGRTLDLRIDHMDLAPDKDGQFRVTEFFCHQDTWNLTLARLADESDAVLMDLRGFSQEKSAFLAGVHELFNFVPLPRILFAVDETTDQPLMRQTMQQAWVEVKDRSPNRRLTAGRVALVDLSNTSFASLHNLLYGLCAAATAVSK